jgi:hypothetical protein
MATEFSMLQIMNAALISEGLDEIVSENDGSDEWRLLARNWPLIVEAELEDGAYHFTKTPVFLQSRQDGSFGYEDAYIVPLAALHVRRLWVEDDNGTRSFPDWVQDGTKVHVNEADGVWIEYITAADEHLWSANFARGVQLKLQAVILNFREERSAAAAVEQQAEMAFQRARTSSSKSRSPTEPYKPSRFARARFTRG